MDETVFEWTVTHKGDAGHTLNVYNSYAQSTVFLANAFQEEGNLQHSRYNLYYVHFHWGLSEQNGSEHRFENTTTTFEVHFVHYSNDYASLGEAVAAYDELSESEDPASNDPHTLGVVGVLFEEVGDDDSYDAGADAVLLEFAQNAEMNTTTKAHVSFAITDLVNVTDFMHAYYAYEACGM